MPRSRALLLVVLAGCRIHFDPLADDAAVSDAPADDAFKRGLGVPGGPFFRSYDTAADALFPSMANPATVSAFRLDETEVTVARFRAFVDRGGGTQLAPPNPGDGAHAVAGGGWLATWTSSLPADSAALKAAALCNTFETWTDAPGSNERLPMNCTSWFVAQAFCISEGGYLPTEAEWNFAAAGGDEQRAFPWSIPPADTTISCLYADYQGCTTGPSNVDALTGTGRWGHSDLGGNVWEWVLDLDGTYPNPCDDCALLTSASLSRIVRGGSFVSTTPNLRTADRFQYAATAHLDNVGFRCAYPP